MAVTGRQPAESLWSQGLWQRLRRRPRSGLGWLAVQGTRMPGCPWTVPQARRPSVAPRLEMLPALARCSGERHAASALCRTRQRKSPPSAACGQCPVEHHGPPVPSAAPPEAAAAATAAGAAASASWSGCLERPMCLGRWPALAAPSTWCAGSAFAQAPRFHQRRRHPTIAGSPQRCRHQQRRQHWPRPACFRCSPCWGRNCRQRPCRRCTSCR